MEVVTTAGTLDFFHVLWNRALEEDIGNQRLAAQAGEAETGTLCFFLTPS